MVCPKLSHSSERAMRLKLALQRYSAPPCIPEWECSVEAAKSGEPVVPPMDDRRIRMGWKSRKNKLSKG